VAAALSHAKKYGTSAYGDTIHLNIGSMALGVITPETAKRRDLEIARFEITRAQFAQFQTLTCVAETKQIDRKCKEFQVRVDTTQNFPQASTTLDDAKLMLSGYLV